MESRVIFPSENVRPSSPTPQNLGSYKFSMVDQLAPSMLVPFVLFYSTDYNTNSAEIISETTKQLKQSLSLILTRFYPLAGRVAEDGHSVDCNDEGVPFSVVQFPGLKLSEFLRNPDQQSLRSLLPCEIRDGAQYGPDSSLALIQVNCFDCGGIAIGAVFVHKMADATTMASFLNSWAATHQGLRLPVCPNYIFQAIFPQKEELNRQSPASTDGFLKAGKSVLKRFMFDSAAISSLKSRTAIQKPTRVEVVSALIWKCFMAAISSDANNTAISACVATHVVNLRRRTKPPFSSECFGNFLGVAAARSELVNGDLGELVEKLRDSVIKQQGFVDMLLCPNQAVQDNLEEDVQVMWTQLLKDADMLAFTSWCSLGLYGVDFGWGKPVWIAKCDIGNHPDSKLVNSVWLMDSRDGDGIEAWVVLEQNYMTVFENVEGLRDLVSVDPTPFHDHISNFP